MLEGPGGPFAPTISLRANAERPSRSRQQECCGNGVRAASGAEMTAAHASEPEGMFVVADAPAGF